MQLIHKLVTILSAILVVVLVAIPIIEDINKIDENEIYVFVLTGQSNSAYYNYNVSTANEELPHIQRGNAYFYGTASKPIYYGINPSSPTYDTTFNSYAIHDMVGSNGNYVIGNVDVAFASQFVKETGKKVAVINTGIGGQSVAQMMPGQLGNNWNKEVYSRAIQGLKDMGFTIHYGSILFIQGETDANMPVATYKDDFKSMLSSYTNYTKCGSLILSLVRPYNAPNPAIAQEQLAEELSNVYMGSTASTTFTVENGLMIADNLHYSQQGDDIIGPQLADCYINKVNPFVTKEGNTFVNSLIGLIPLLLILAVIIAIVKWFIDEKINSMD